VEGGRSRKRERSVEQTMEEETCKFTQTVLLRSISGLTVNIVAHAFTAADPLGSGGINLMPMHFSRAKLWCMLILKQGLDGLLSCQ
jgi:hypothetical protein